MEKRERILTRMKKSKMVSIVGGKKSERAMPVEWFGDGIQLKFRAQVVYGPTNYQAYLERIYGEGYATHNPARYRINERQQIEVSASIIDFDNSYLELQLYKKEKRLCLLEIRDKGESVLCGTTLVPVLGTGT